MQQKSYRIAFCGVMLATIAVAMALDKLMSMAFPISTAVIVLLITFSFCFIQNDWLTGFLAGAFFGIASLIKAIIFKEYVWITEACGDAPLAFLYALCIYLLPRLFVGIGGFGAYKLMRKLLNGMTNRYAKETIALSIGTFIGLVINTVLFLTSLNIAKELFNVAHNTLFGIIKTVLYVNILPEYLISILAVPHVVIRVRKAMHYGTEANIEIYKEENNNVTCD